ncbi:FAD-binding protein [Aeromicrobium sp. 636]|uniref:Delta(24)-sterol reductase n=1 Tax=Aeromicrobium senzhongii TaxID=2663859 RepID=A0A8I0EXL6_9ACTN|nr:FAD-binding oxidoreductase [Aeromicrobium senzhongii]MBC9227247.1 FAD-binding oxidoreductase [Aeromicrobium senzhongii]MCQ3999345.1 FAD-binding protein [Aeromicrobium sp. 636]
MQGWTQHQDAVAALRASWDAIGPGQPVRLAKKTSNLFRPRRRSAGPGLDVSGLDGVIAIDPDARTADVQGMCTYERLVDETLAHGLMPSVVPQLRTITLGGAVTGLGIESTSLRLGLPHEAVLEMDVLTGSGEIVTATPDNEHADLFAAFPNSYGSLGYAVRLRIELQPAPRQVRLRHVPFAGAADVVKALAEIADAGRWDGIPVDAVDGTAFSPDEIYLTLAQFTDTDLPTSDYTGQDVYYRSIRQRHEDVLTIHDYLWRWDTDWFWCSGAFGAQNPSVRRLWPRRWRRSDVYHRLVALDGTVGVSRVLDRIKHVPARERVIQDIEVPLDRLEDFLTWFDREVGMRPVWLCPLRTRRAWPTYPLTPGDVYVNVGFWGTVVVPAGSEPGAVNRKVEGEVHRLGGHKSLYSEAFYDRETFGALYDTAGLDRVRSTYDPDSRLNTLYDKAVRNS